MENEININSLIYPLFIIKGEKKKEPINSMPGIFRMSSDILLKEIEELKALGIDKVLLFGIPDKKDDDATEAYKDNNIISEAVKLIKSNFPNMNVMTDVCLCAYTSHGHCGIVDNQNIDNQKTLLTLSKIALSHACAGADYVAPSAMADNQVAAIRRELNNNGYQDTKIMGYSAKFASSFYGPFRDVADSAPKFGDRRAYQLDYRDKESALKKVQDDINEGADIVMVKPALSYLDIIKEVKDKFNYPLAAYNVSGEYSMVKLGVQQGFFNERKIVTEIMTGIKRAGADMIITYHAKDLADWSRNEK